MYISWFNHQKKWSLLLEFQFFISHLIRCIISVISEFSFKNRRYRCRVTTNIFLPFLQNHCRVVIELPLLCYRPFGSLYFKNGTLCPVAASVWVRVSRLVRSISILRRPKICMKEAAERNTKIPESADRPSSSQLTTRFYGQHTRTPSGFKSVAGRCLRDIGHEFRINGLKLIAIKTSYLLGRLNIQCSLLLSFFNCIFNSPLSSALYNKLVLWRKHISVFV